MKETFLTALHSKKKLSVTFYSKEDGSIITRKCAPMDYGPSRTARNKEDRYHFWDYDSDSGSHTLPLLPNQIKSMEILNEHFDPALFINWKPNWWIKRDWGIFS